MSVTAKIENDIQTFYSKKNKLDLLNASGISTAEEIEEAKKLNIEIENMLTQVLALYKKDTLANSFYLQVNEAEQLILNLYQEKKEQLKEQQEEQKEVFELAKELLGYIYSIDILNKNVHVGYNIEKRLLDIKTSVQRIDIAERRTYACKFLAQRVELYEKDLISLLDIVKNYQYKQEIVFDKKQELLRIFSRMSFDYNFNENHNKIFGENEEGSMDNNLAIDYVYLYEKIFLEMCQDAGITLTSYYTYLKDLVESKKISFLAVTNKVIFIAEKYKSDIENFIEKQAEEIEKFSKDISTQIMLCFTYDGMTNLNKILCQIEDAEELPTYLESSHNVEILKNMLFGLNVTMMDDINICNILDDVKKEMEHTFDKYKYLKMYEYNPKNKNIQIAKFRQYYIGVLEEAKEKVKKEYIGKIEKLCSTKLLHNYSTKDMIKSLERLDAEVNLLEQALQQINQKYRTFENENLQIYMNAIEEKFQVSHVYEKVSKKKYYFKNKFKSAKKIEAEKRYIYNFLNKEAIKIGLRKNLITLLISQDVDLREQILSKIEE